MSLQKCPNCNKQIGFMTVYKKINKKRFNGKYLLKCKKCKSKLGIKHKKRTIVESFLKGFLWMGFPLLLIVLVASERLDALLAILIVILYHIIAIAFIIKLYNYNKIKKG